MIRTFIDAGILIKAIRSQTSVAIEIIELLDDPDRQFLSTSLVELEVIPKAVYQKQKAETAFYREYFQTKAQRIPVDEALIQRAAERAMRLGLNALDSLHLEAAISAGADEFITTEKLTKPLFRESAIRVTSM